jgi:hypothetical protein
MAYNIGPAAYYAAAISLPLVAWFILSHLSELRGTYPKTKSRKQEMHKESI